ncbi:hypothetical protein PoB_005017300 [Plakobranchus ocellatus]|uniref:Uncharacterized protein n=1 Tax=Plakobranchus ocellatus TaxID=259542 RepID=A0AAV4BXY8_9GAST|nr:hypothetical protein PoB_005017300 [Plakobranchus ocellatus]
MKKVWTEKQVAEHFDRPFICFGSASYDDDEDEDDDDDDDDDDNDDDDDDDDDDSDEREILTYQDSSNNARLFSQLLPLCYGGALLARSRR